MAETLRKVERAALASVAAAPRAPAQPPLRLCVLRGDDLVQLPGGAALTSPVRQFAATSGVALTSTMAGELLCWRASSPLASALPPFAVADVANAAPLSLPSRAGIVAAGAEHALAIDASGDVHVIGGGVGRRSSKGDACVPRPLGGMDGLRVLQVACGAAHSLLLVARRGEGGGEVHAVGENSCGQLGLGHTAPQPRPRRATELCAPGVSRVEAGAASSFAVAAAATRAVGCNTHGQLGNGRRAAAELRAVRVGGGAGDTAAVARISVHPATAEARVALGPRDGRVARVAVGARHSLILTIGGAVLGCGANAQCELGRADGASECEPTPAPLTLPTTAAVQQCVCADAAPTALLLTADRRIWCV